ncbi:L-asparaginase, type II [Paenisporosarcina sp. HGH0030]|uniref:asparaginase n=1 Tax=Paenisporosarcina sp. HGH0030 TaxID=1078085 RepID=UPI00034EAB7E|nr:asparaginase [Paenisporosarcina sp. HGH0030]EPD53193.1 L-asparaginase, type II [Paenisporosarcina sp. HGH0030]
MKKIVVIHTGGTISMHVQDESGAVVPGDSNPLTAEIDKLKEYADIHEIEAFNYPSPHMTPTEMLKLKQIIDLQSTENHVDGFVITHGTDTLEETAYFLDLTVKSNIPIILTGAMRSSNEIGADGVYNLLSAVRVAITADANGKGVLVVMNDEIHTAQNVTKTSTSNVSTFQSPQYGPIGLISKTTIHFHHTPNSRESFEVDDVSPKVALLKIYAGMDADLLMHVANSGYSGVVLEGLGQGNVPPAIIPAIKQLILQKIPVVLVSRCYNGIAQPVYGYVGGGKMLEEMGVLFAHGLSGQKARIKLLIALSDARCSQSLQTIFEY